MIAEAIKTLVALAHESARAQVLRIPGIEDEAWIVRGNEPPQQIKLPAPRRAAVMHSFYSFVDYLKDAANAPAPHVYFSTDKLTGVLDSADRREVITMPLVFSERFRLLAAMAGQPFRGSPSDVVKLIRFKLQASGLDVLISKLRKVDFVRLNSSTSETGHGRDTMGRSVEARVQAIDEIPETFDVEIPIWSNDGMRGIVARVRVGIFLDTMQSAIEIAPLADEIQSALEAGQSQVFSALQSTLPKVPHFNGEARFVSDAPAALPDAAPPPPHRR